MIPDDQRMTEEEIDEATKGLKGRERWQMAARIAEERAYEVGLVGREDQPAHTVQCPDCKGTGRMWGYGGQCKTCFGTRVVKALVEDVVEEANEAPVAN